MHSAYIAICSLEIPRVQHVIVRSLYHIIRKMYRFREKQAMLKFNHILVQDCVTRWGSTLSMLEKILEQQAAIAAVLMEGRLRHLMPEVNDWGID